MSLPDDVAAALRDPATPVVVTRPDGHVAVAGGCWPADVPAGAGPVVAGGAVALVVDEAAAAALEAATGLRFAEARAALLDRDDASDLLGAVAFGQWRTRTRFCPRCGAPLAPRPGGRTLSCTAGHLQFPRLEPAVIMRVVDRDDRILLARQPTWPPGRVSVLAGFVDPGESLEDAVRREVREEVGIDVDDVAYVRSQPWPFPASLMLAFTAVATTTAIRPEDDEIAEAAWYSRDELRAAMAAGHVALPTPLSVAHHLVRSWLAAGGGDAAELAVGTARPQPVRDPR